MLQDCLSNYKEDKSLKLAFKCFVCKLFNSLFTNPLLLFIEINVGKFSFLRVVIRIVIIRIVVLRIV